MGSPSLKNDNIAIPEMMNHYGSMNLEEARSWAVVGCNTPGITINSRGAHRRSARCINSLKSVEFALYNGRDGDPEWGWVKSVETGDPVLFKTWEEFYQAWLKQWHWLIREGLNLRNISDRYFNKIIRRPFLSNLYKKCIEEGISKGILTLSASKNVWRFLPPYLITNNDIEFIINTVSEILKIRK